MEEKLKKLESELKAIGINSVDELNEAIKKEKFSWKGQHDIFVNEGAVNGAREMTLSILPSTEVYNKDAATQFAG